MRLKSLVRDKRKVFSNIKVDEVSINKLTIGNIR